MNNTKFPFDLKIVIIWTILTGMFIFIPVLNETFLRIIFAWTLILFLPGYVLIAFLFPKKSDLGLIERIALSVGLSAGITPALGIILNFTPFGIRLVPIFIILSIFIIIFTILTYLRLRNIPKEECYNENFTLSKIYSKISESMKFFEGSTDKALSMLLTLSVAFCIFTLIFVISVPKEGEKFTEFYILNTDGNANWYPTNLSDGENFTINVNIVCREKPVKYTIYKLEIKWNDSDEILYRKYISLQENETFSENFTFTANIKDTAQNITKENRKLEFLLYKDGSNEIYRILHLWIDIKNKIENRTVENSRMPDL